MIGYSQIRKLRKGPNGGLYLAIITDIHWVIYIASLLLTIAACL